VLVPVVAVFYIASLESDAQQGIELHRWAVWGVATTVPSVILFCLERRNKSFPRLTVSLLLLLLWIFVRASF
jgi:hypothetical protein